MVEIPQVSLHHRYDAQQRSDGSKAPVVSVL
jgi:hypothetical protein